MAKSRDSPRPEKFMHFLLTHLHGFPAGKNLIITRYEHPVEIFMIPGDE
jgi:hypothetical protein